MHHSWFHLHRTFFRFRDFVPEEFFALLLALLIFSVPAGASTRFENRGLYMKSSLPNATTSYVVSLSYMTPAAIGSLDLLFCESPIPDDPCVPPAGLDASAAVLSAQTGEQGFSILSKSPNHIILTRPPSMITASGSQSSYTFDTIKNPSSTGKAFAIRMKSLTTQDGTGPQVDFGSVRGQATEAISIETQVPPMLIFCVAQTVEENCTGTDDTHYTNMGTLSADETLTAQSQMAVGTNASAGFAITVNGTSMAAGTTVINSPKAPTESKPGTDQFGINLVANDAPLVGKDPEGEWANAQPTADYGQINKYKYAQGDVIASSPNVSLMKKFTVSYIVNSNPNLRAGVYTTTINYIASGRF
jgi:hypothetical protein